MREMSGKEFGACACVKRWEGREWRVREKGERLEVNGEISNREG